MADQKPPWGVVQWGMVVDADRCTGCKACVVACRSENNIATVGAEQSAMGRMMDWIRIERMFQVRQVLAQRRLRDVQGLRSTRDAADVDHAHKEAQLLEFECARGDRRRAGGWARRRGCGR